MAFQLPVRADSIETIANYVQRRGIEDTIPEHLRSDLLVGDKTPFALAPTNYDDPFKNVVIAEITRSVRGHGVSRRLASGLIVMIDRNLSRPGPNGQPVHRLRMLGSDERFGYLSQFSEWQNQKTNLVAEAIVEYANAEVKDLELSRRLLAGISFDAVLNR